MEHLDVAIKLHHIETVMVMDHRDCGAYKVVLGEDFSKDKAKETGIHATQLRTLKGKILEKHEHLKVEMLLMGRRATSPLSRNAEPHQNITTETQRHRDTEEKPSMACCYRN